MNYIDWLQRKFSSLINVSSAETYGYIKQVKSETKFILGFISLAIFITIIFPSSMLLSSMGYILSESVIYWCTF
ncbi:hypothetical protein DFP80_10131 [Marinomonas rhizomae]|uniref:Uncharacterized protein n=1 Tax=Marinomonas rhizomae TaxID=491948 RepID=A0A366JEZ0_9GAMM|nr:hypothetical protein DFP80_10131 [Marinomonas rhizomae]